MLLVKGRKWLIQSVQVGKQSRLLVPHESGSRVDLLTPVNLISTPYHRHAQRCVS